MTAALRPVDTRQGETRGKRIDEAVQTPGDIILLMSWRDQLEAETFEKTVSPQESARLRRVRVVRDYGMYDRREAPQYYPDAHGGETVHS